MNWFYRLLKDKRGTVSFIETALALFLLMPFFFMILDVFAGLEQFHLARSLRNQYMTVVKVDGQLTTDNLTKFTKDANDAGFDVKKFEIKRSNGTLVGGTYPEAVVQDTLNFDNSRMELSIELKPQKPPFLTGKVFGKTLSTEEYVIPLKGVTWSDLDKIRN